jgi:hypothetical protein
MKFAFRKQSPVSLIRQVGYKKSVWKQIFFPYKETDQTYLFVIGGGSFNQLLISSKKNLQALQKKITKNPLYLSIKCKYGQILNTFFCSGYSFYTTGLG